MTASLIVLSLVLAVMPLSDAQRIALETAHDGRDHQEEAFAALVENAGSWTGDVGDEPVHLRINVAALRDDPESARGGVFQIQGMLAQRDQLPEPWGRVQEWYVRLGDGEPVIVYVVDRQGRAWTEGERVQLPARFYKIMSKQARDGEMRQYAAFVGAHPRAVMEAQAVSGAPAFLMPAMLILLAAFAALFFLLRRKRSALSPRRLHIESERDVSAAHTEPPLPADPAQALEELRRRAGR